MQDSVMAAPKLSCSRCARPAAVWRSRNRYSETETSREPRISVAAADFARAALHAAAVLEQEAARPQEQAAAALGSGEEGCQDCMWLRIAWQKWEVDVSHLIQSSLHFAVYIIFGKLYYCRVQCIFTVLF